MLSIGTNIFYQFYLFVFSATYIPFSSVNIDKLQKHNVDLIYHKLIISHDSLLYPDRALIAFYTVLFYRV